MERGGLLEARAGEGEEGSGGALVELLAVEGVEGREVERRETQSERDRLGLSKRLVRLFSAYEQPTVFVPAIPTIVLGILSRLSMQERVCAIPNKAIGTSKTPHRSPLVSRCPHPKRRAVYCRCQSAILLGIRRR